MPREGEISQENSMKFPGKPSQEASGNKQVGFELELRVDRGQMEAESSEEMVAERAGEPAGWRLTVRLLIFSPKVILYKVSE